MISGDFKSLTDDLCFKYIFSKKYILEDFINSFLRYIKLNNKFKFTEITMESCIMPDNKIYYGDITATLDNENIISLEMYRNTFDKEKYNKSFAYMNRLFDKNIAKNGYKQAKKVFSVNLIKGNFRRINSELVNDYVFCNKDNKKVIDDGNTELYLIRFDKVKNIPYNKLEMRFITYLRLINAASLEELKKYSKGDEIMSDVEKFVAEWNRKSAKGGFERYVKEQREEAEKKSIIKTAKNLLSLNIDIKDIEKATGLSEKELNKLKRDNY